MPIYEPDDQQAWEAKMARVERIWEILADVWESHHTEYGWDVYYALEQLYGVVPEPNVLTPELVHEGLLPTYDDAPWKEWVSRCLTDYQARIRVEQ